MILVPSTVLPSLLPWLKVCFTNRVKKVACNKEELSVSRASEATAVVLALPCYSSGKASSSGVLSRQYNSRHNLDQGAPVLNCTLLHS